MDNKIVTARFATDDNYVNVYDVYQWDYGQVLRIEGLKLPNMVEIHFSLQETSGEAKTRIGVTKDGVTDVVIPDSFLENEGIGDNYKIFVWVYVADKESGSTEYKITIHVKVRAKPEVPGGGDNPDIFHEAVLEVRKSAEKAEEAQRQAEGWAHGREDLPERAEDNAMYYAGKASEDAKKTAQDKAEVERLTESNTQMQGEVAKDLEEVKKLSSQAQTSATNAALSEQKSKEAATRAETAQTGAETAKNNAELAAQKTGQDKTAVEQAKKLVQQMGQEVLDNKNAVDKTVQDFDLTAQQALTDVNNAGQTQTGRVQSAGTTAVENIENAQNTATQAVETAKSEAIKAVQTEGTTQTGNVTAEGEKQVQAVQTAAQEIIADREQIAKNKTDIADLRQKKADAIVETANGTLLNVKDSSGAFFEDFSMSGKTTQDGTPTPDTPVPIVNAGESGNIEVKVVGKNILDVETATPKGWNLDITNLSNFEAGRTYTMTVVSLNDSSCGLFLDDHNKLVTYLNPGQSASFVMPDKSTFTKMSLCGGTETALLKDRSKVKVQIELGDKPTAYEPYKEPQTLTLQLDRPLTKWDRIEKREGIWGIVRQGETKVLKAAPEEEWATWEDKQNAFFIMNDKIIKEGLCSHFEAKGSFEIGKETGIYLFETIHLIVTDINIDSLEDWKTWLQANPIAVAYKIAEETWEPLPEEMQSVLNALHTNYPTTVVTNSENVNMQLTYVADTKNYYLNREQTIQKQILEIQNALISQKISGGDIKVTNSAELPIVKLSVFGKSEQNGVPTAENPVPIVSAGESGNIEIEITGKNLINVSEDAISSSYNVGSYTIKNGVIAFDTANNWGGDYLYFNDIDVSKNKELVFRMEATMPEEQDTEEKGAKILFKAYNKLGEEIKDSESAISNDTWKKAYNNHYKGLIYYRRGSNIPIKFSSVVAKIKVGVCFLDVIARKAVTIRDYQVEYGTTSTAYEPYKEQTTTLQTPNGLLGLKVDVNGNYTDENGQQWIADEIDLARGKYVQRIGKHACTGNENIIKSFEDESVIEYMFHAEGVSSNVLYESNGLSTHYEYLNTRKGGTCTIGAGKYAYIRYNVADNVTPAQIQEFYRRQKEAGTPVTFYYILAEPVEYNLPPETIAAFKQLHTNYPTTLISNNADAGMELTYTVDTQSYIDGKIAEVSKAII